jgi:hypothetical protein
MIYDNYPVIKSLTVKERIEAFKECVTQEILGGFTNFSELKEYKIHLIEMEQYEMAQAIDEYIEENK